MIDTGLARVQDWSPYQIKLVLASEVFSEEWRDLVAERAGMRRAAYDSAALYGTADAGVLGPWSSRPGELATAERAGLAADAITTQLRKLNSEFAHYVPEGQQAPHVRLLPAGDPGYVPRGVKRRHTRGPAQPPS